ncbi:hypothetical protein V1478_006119 [Vespula squamosa]
MEVDSLRNSTPLFRSGARFGCWGSWCSPPLALALQVSGMARKSSENEGKRDLEEEEEEGEGEEEEKEKEEGEEEEEEERESKSSCTTNRIEGLTGEMGLEFQAILRSQMEDPVPGTERVKHRLKPCFPSRNRWENNGPTGLKVSDKCSTRVAALTEETHVDELSEGKSSQKPREKIP